MLEILSLSSSVFFESVSMGALRRVCVPLRNTRRIDAGLQAIRPGSNSDDESVMTTVTTGEICPKSGQYRVLGFSGIEITLSRGDRVPPYKGSARTFVLADATRHYTRW